MLVHEGSPILGLGTAAMSPLDQRMGLRRWLRGQCKVERNTGCIETEAE
jgi:hypothetical protein